VSRVFLLFFAAVLVVAGIAGICMGVMRIVIGDEPSRGLANMLVGGFVALTGATNWEDAK